MYQYIIDWDNKSKLFRFRVTTYSGITAAYFRTEQDAIAWCETGCKTAP